MTAARTLTQPKEHGSPPRSLWLTLALTLMIAVMGRALLLASGTLSFHSDEAIVGLLARHILAGERPIFFMGQAYMGTLDSWLIAVGFRLLGESVMAIRLVQSALYLLVVASAYYAAWALSRRVTIAWVTSLTFAIGSPLVTLYTTATLGGYNEAMILGHLLVGLGYTIARDPARAPWRWAVFGLAAGLGWWTNALIVVYAVPVGIYLLYRLVRGGRLPVGGVVLAVVGFFIGSAPWWVYSFSHELATIRFFFPDLFQSDEPVGAMLPSQPFDVRILGLFLFGFPVVIGARFPWTGDYFAPLIGVIVLTVFVFAWYVFWRRRKTHLLPGVFALMGGIVIMLCAVYLITRFSSDPSGRYFLPLTLPFGFALGVFVSALPGRILGAGVMLLVLGYFAAGQWSAARAPEGFTTQFVANTHLHNGDDDALMAWLDEHDIQHGYTSYWVSFRLAFLSGERIQLSASVPDNADLAWTTAFERYAPYRQATDSAERVAYIILGDRLPEVETALTAWFADEGVQYEMADVGIYRIYYDFTPRVPRPPLPFIPS